MAREFKGKNNLKSSFSLYYWRTRFANEAYDDILGPKCARNLNFAEYQHYAQLSPDGDPVVPNEDKIVALRDPSNPSKVFYVFDFVADMFIDLKTHIDLAIASGKLCKTNPIFNSFGPVSAYSSPAADYNTYINKLMAIYVSSVIPNIYGTSNIMDFNSFVKNFFNYINDFAKGVPITYTGWLISKNTGIRHTAASLMIAEMTHGDDQAKIDNLIDTPQFSFYELLLINIGFNFDFQNPAVLFADLASPAIFKYYKKFNVSSIDNLFKQYYIKSYYKDIDILKDRILHFYNIYTTTNPHQIRFSLCNKKTKWHWELRTGITKSQMESIFPESYWISKLVDLRNHECENKIDSAKIKKIKKYAILLDKTAALDYINSETKGLYFEREYGFEDIRRRVLAKTQVDVKKQGITGKSVFNGGGY
jgi:hypothetical protein